MLCTILSFIFAFFMLFLSKKVGRGEKKVYF